MESALQVQIGGAHYKSFKIQPVEFITKNNLNFLQGCIVKRICRFNQPGGKGREDLQKIKHEIDLLMELSDKCAGNDLSPQANCACCECDIAKSCYPSGRQTEEI